MYHYQGLIIDNGGLPYADFIEKKGPIGLLTYGLAAVLFGTSAMAYRIFDLIILSMIAVLLVKITSKEFPKWTSVLVCILWFLNNLVDGPGNTGDVTNIITLFALWSFYLINNSKEKANYLWIGMFCAIA